MKHIYLHKINKKIKNNEEEKGKLESYCWRAETASWTSSLEGPGPKIKSSKYPCPLSLPSTDTHSKSSHWDKGGQVGAPEVADVGILLLCEAKGEEVEERERLLEEMGLWVGLEVEVVVEVEEEMGSWRAAPAAAGTPVLALTTLATCLNMLPPSPLPPPMPLPPNIVATIILSYVLSTFTVFSSLSLSDQLSVFSRR
jgi:hypothetical protein